MNILEQTLRTRNIQAFSNNVTEHNPEIVPFTNTAVVVSLSILLSLGTLFSITAITSIVLRPSAYMGKSPFFSLVILTGTLIGYMACFVHIAPPNKFTCGIFPSLMSISFTLAYGALFLKTWRFWRICEKANKFQLVSIPNSQLVKLIGIIFAFEIPLLIAWAIIDPYSPNLWTLTGNKAEIVCYSPRHGVYLMWLLLGTKFIWLAFGGYMAFRSRIYTSEFNEAPDVAFCIYNSLVCFILAAALQNIIDRLLYSTPLIYCLFLSFQCAFIPAKLYLPTMIRIRVFLLKTHHKSNYDKGEEISSTMSPSSSSSSSSGDSRKVIFAETKIKGTREDKIITSSSSSDIPLTSLSSSNIPLISSSTNIPLASSPSLSSDIPPTSCAPDV